MKTVLGAAASLIATLLIGALVPIPATAPGQGLRLERSVAEAPVDGLLMAIAGEPWLPVSSVHIAGFGLSAGAHRSVEVRVMNGGTQPVRITRATLDRDSPAFLGENPGAASIAGADLLGYQLVPGQATAVTVTATAPIGWPATRLFDASDVTLSLEAQPSAGVCGSAGVAGPPPALTGTLVGAFETGFPQSQKVVTGVTGVFGGQPDIASVFDNVGGASYQSPVNAITRAAGHGMTALVTLQIRDGGSATNDPAYSLARINGGEYDAQICRFAQETASTRTPVIVRYLHEMNGAWYPWGAGVNGNTGQQYVAAYRHVFEIFKEAGATNAAIMWSPNAVDKLSTNLSDYFPGTRYFDVAGPDVYNTAGVPTADALYGATVRQIRGLTEAPIFFAETGASPSNSRAAFIASLFAYVRTSPDVIGFTYLQITGSADGATGDYEIAPGTDAAAAFSEGMRRGLD